MNKYIGYFNGKQTTVEAETSYEALQKAVAIFKPAKSKQHMVHVHLHEKDGKAIYHSTASL